MELRGRGTKRRRQYETEFVYTNSDREKEGSHGRRREKKIALQDIIIRQRL